MSLWSWSSRSWLWPRLRLRCLLLPLLLLLLPPLDFLRMGRSKENARKGTLIVVVQSRSFLLFFRVIPSLECIYITIITLVFSPAYTTHTTHRIITSCSPRFRRGKHVGQKKSRLIIMSFLLPPALYCNDHDTGGEGAYIYICMDTGSIRPT